MSTISMAFGSTVCSVMHFAGTATPTCYNPSEVNVLGSMFMTFIAMLTIGWQAARRV